MKTSKTINFALMAISLLAFTACGGDDGTVRVPRTSLNQGIIGTDIVVPAPGTLACPADTIVLQIATKNAVNYDFTNMVTLVKQGGTPLNLASVNATNPSSEAGVTYVYIRPAKQLDLDGVYFVQLRAIGETESLSRDFRVVSNATGCTADNLQLSRAIGRAQYDPSKEEDKRGNVREFRADADGIVDANGSWNFDSIGDLGEELLYIKATTILQDIFGTTPSMMDSEFRFNEPLNVASVLGGLKIYIVNDDFTLKILSDSPLFGQPSEFISGCPTLTQVQKSSFEPIAPNSCLGFGTENGQVDWHTIKVMTPQNLPSGNYFVVLSKGLSSQRGASLEKNWGVFLGYKNPSDAVTFSQ